MKKFILIFAVIIASSFLTTSCTNNVKNNQNNRGFNIKVKKGPSPENVDTLYSDSTYVIKGVANKDSQDIRYIGVDFAVTEVEVLENIKGDIEGKFNLLQTICEDDPIVEKETDVLLFLEKYNGPIHNDAYVCKYLGEGHYKVTSNETIVPSLDTINQPLKRSLNYHENLLKYLRSKQ